MGASISHFSLKSISDGLRCGAAGGATLKGHGCAGQSIMQAAMTVVEMARVDASMSTFLMVHNSLCMLTIGLLGSERQRAELLPDLASLQTVGAPPQPPRPGPPSLPAVAAPPWSNFIPQRIRWTPVSGRMRCVGTSAASLMFVG